jgi:hypothetical protein
MKASEAVLRFISVTGAAIGYGFLLAFLYLVGMQVYQWFRDGEWTHVGLADGLRVGLVRCCVKDGDNGRLAAFLHWLDAPASWLGLHRMFEAIPASLALFAVSIVGNCVFIYCREIASRGAKRAA